MGEDKCFGALGIIIARREICDLFFPLPITYSSSSVSVSRRKVLSCLFWMPRPSLSWAEQRSLSISHMGPMVCLTRWARFATLCNSVANCWNWTSNQPLYPQNRKSLSMSFPVKLLNCKRQKEIRAWKNCTLMPFVCASLMGIGACPHRVLPLLLERWQSFGG